MSDNSDVNDLLAELTGGAKKEPPRAAKNPLARGEEDKTDYGVAANEGSGFRIDPRERYGDGAELGENPEDFTDIVGKQDARRRGKRSLIFLVGAIFLVALGYTGYTVISHATSAPVSTANEEGSPQAEQRFLGLYPEAPAPDTTKPSIARVSESGVSVANGYGIALPPMELVDLDYRATAATEFGPAAKSTVEGPWQGTTVYLFKDMVRSKAFRDAQEGELVEVEGSPAAAVMTLELTGGERTVLAALAPDSTGFMVVLPEGATLEEAKALTPELEITAPKHTRGK